MMAVLLITVTALLQISADVSGIVIEGENKWKIVIQNGPKNAYNVMIIK
jgi:hypothetical protein